MSEPAEDSETLVSLPRIVEDVASLLAYEAARDAVAVRINFDGEPRTIASDSDMRIVVLNLIQNAFHAMLDGGRLTISGSCDDAGHVVLKFEDTGVGIDDADLNHIFWPFWSARADGIRGTGLGLSICKALVDRLGGNISVKSKRGQGTCFIIHLPNADVGELPL